MLRYLPIAWFVLSLALAAFALGLAVGNYKFPPYTTIVNAVKTIKATYRDWTWDTYLGQFKMKTPDMPLDELATDRLTVTDAGRGYSENLLINGGLNEFLEHCPERGCVAVEVDRQGEVIHAYPYRPDEIFAADITDGAFAHESVPDDPAKIMRPLGIQRYENGDLLITFHSVRHMFPFASGVTRVDREGHPRWFRFDYSHHWATLLPDGTALVPSLRVGEGDWKVPIGPETAWWSVHCETQRPQIDEVQVLDGDGEVVRTLDISASLKDSNWSGILAETSNGCDPLHLNYVDVIGEDSGPDLVPGDLVLSLRNFSAFAIADPRSGEIKRVIRGSFVQQHSVHHLTGNRFLLFDNWGGDASGPPSRLLEVDIATGTMRRVFPKQEGAHEVDPLFSSRASHIDISPDQKRILVSYSDIGKGFEVELATGRVLASYEAVHDLSGVPDAPEAFRSRAARADLFGIHHIAP